MKFIIAKTVEELYDALKSSERSLEIKFINNRITKFPTMPDFNHEGVVVLRLYTPNLKSIKNAPCIATQMNWLIVEEANLTKIETAGEANIDQLTVCALPCLEYKDYDIDANLLISNGFVRLSLAWQQFTKQSLRNLATDKDYRISSKVFACFHEMSSGMSINNLPDKCPEFIKNILKEYSMLSYVEHKIAMKVASMDIGEVALECI